MHTYKKTHFMVTYKTCFMCVDKTCMCPHTYISSSTYRN